MLLYLIAMLVLGLLSAALSYQGRNYYVRLFDDILGREEEETMAAKVGRGFVYGFLFPIYFGLILIGLISLIIFLLVAGVVAAIVFALVWATEKLVPKERLGEIVCGLFDKMGLTRYSPAPELVRPGLSPGMSPAHPSESALPPETKPAGEPPRPAESDDQGPFPGGGINRTRRHSLD
ncbi:MAG: hypothetical protein FJ118_07970 [Deltaproteobacteria bacterium]|nr:hypothetical protein [Deltaproteobacteria bacterium]